MIVPKPGNVARTYSQELERIRRLELRPGGAALSTDWQPFLYNDINIPTAYYRIHLGSVFLSGYLPATEGFATPDYSSWHLAGTMPEDGRPLSNTIAQALWHPSSPVATIAGPSSPQGVNVPVMLLTDGRVLFPGSEYYSTSTFVPTPFPHFVTTWQWLHGSEPHFDLVSSYFPLG